MLAQERQHAILEILAQQGGIIKMKDIASQFQVSNETARRDLEVLQDQKLVTRVYGGAILTDRREPLALPHQRGSESAGGNNTRVMIGRAAAELVHDGEVVILASGSTILEVARHLKRLRDLTVLTNSLAVINELIETNFNIYVLGGKLDNNELNMSGAMGVRAIQGIFADKTFIGAGGITFQYGVSDYGSSDAAIRAEMISRANQTILVAQSDKFGRNTFSLDTPLDQIHTIVSDSALTQEYADGIREMGIELILAQE